MIESFVQQWPEDINLRIYHEDDLRVPESNRYQLFDLRDNEPELFEFINRHKDREDQQNPLELHRGAISFSYKVFSVLNAGNNSDADYMIWLDADTFTHSPVSHEFLNTLVDAKKHLTYLGRSNTYSEAGFVVYNLKHEIQKPFFETWRNLYRTDELFNLPQWHDCLAMDRIRQAYENEFNIENTNLTPWGKNYDHVFINSVLGEYMDHMKGGRKQVGKSNKSDLFTERKAEYWRNI